MATDVIRELKKYFNSIKVRLEQFFVPYLLSFLKNFNSIKVRLEPVVGNIIIHKIKFQFHKGTIRTQYQNGIN